MTVEPREVTHGVVAISDEFGWGVVEVFDNEVDAYRQRREIREAGDWAEVIEKDGEEWSEEGEELISAAMDAFFGRTNG